MGGFHDAKPMSKVDPDGTALIAVLAHSDVRRPRRLAVTDSGTDVKSSEPLNETPGTGVSRTDYVAWSEPVDLNPSAVRARLPPGRTDCGVRR